MPSCTAGHMGNKRHLNHRATEHTENTEVAEPSPRPHFSWIPALQLCAELSVVGRARAPWRAARRHQAFPVSRMHSHGGPWEREKHSPPSHQATKNEPFLQSADLRRFTQIRFRPRWHGRLSHERPGPQRRTKRARKNPFLSLLCFFVANNVIRQSLRCSRMLLSFRRHSVPPACCQSKTCGTITVAECSECGGGPTAPSGVSICYGHQHCAATRDRRIVHGDCQTRCE